MAAMDLRTNQEVMGVQSRYSADYGGHMFKGKDAFEEADIKGNNNIFNSLKTEVTSNHSHDSSSLCEVNCSNKKKLEVDNSLFSYSSFKKAMDLRTHNRTLDGGRRTIFDDAEYFAKNHCYKLLPITFEHVDETIIRSEHNYSLFSLASESEPEEDCSRMMDYSQIREKNYKRRRTKFRERSEEPMECETTDAHENDEAHLSPVFCERNESLADGPEASTDPLDLDSENLAAVQPLDLSGPLLPEEKTDLPLREGDDDDSAQKNDEVGRLDSDKENVGLELSGIRVTITRPDEERSYQPCDLFLSDIARLVPWLVDKDCFEVDILDRTCEGHDEFRKHRLYYVISESTWRLFQTSNERVILTNDQSLGPPARKAEKDGRPSFLVFDQFSLAKCLAEYCQEMGGCFEYTCVEEGKDQELAKEKNAEEVKKEEETMEVTAEVKVTLEAEEEEGIKEVEVTGEMKVAVETEEEEQKEATEEVTSDADVGLPTADEQKKPEVDAPEEVGVCEKPEEEVACANEEVEEITEKQNGVLEQVSPSVEKTKKEEKGKKAVKKKMKKAKGTRSQKRPPIQPKPKNSQITTRSKSTSESETSQKSDERVNAKGGRKRGGGAFPREQPPTKKPAAPEAPPEAPPRRTRSAALEKPKAPAPVRKDRADAGATGTRRREAAQEATGAARRLRSQRAVQRPGEGRRRTRAKGRKR